jgi:glutathione synthase/RimK-type ligase-like ATP-grasp enzyme
MKRTVLITVNPLIVESKEFSTMRKFVSTLDKCFDLYVLPIEGYDFARGRVRAYRRLKGGAFEDVGMMTPAGDLWIVYSDGFYLDERRFGFRARRDYFNAQIDFHHRHLSAGRVRLMVNPPEADSKALKSWLATLNFEQTRVIPTYVCSRIEEVYDLQKKHQRLVAKPVWGGGSNGVQMLADEASVSQFRQALRKRHDGDLSDFCFQVFREGDEKRLWFAGGEFVGGRRFRGCATPWSRWTHDYQIATYDKKSRHNFKRDLAAARDLCKLSGIEIGSVDFIGDEINEINGCGTVLTTFHNRKLFIDTRLAFVDYFQRLVSSL